MADLRALQIVVDQTGRTGRILRRLLGDDVVLGRRDCNIRAMLCSRDRTEGHDRAMICIQRAVSGHIGAVIGHADMAAMADQALDCITVVARHRRGATAEIDCPGNIDKHGALDIAMGCLDAGNTAAGVEQMAATADLRQVFVVTAVG